MEMVKVDKAKIARQRSPNFPSLPLDKCIEFSKLLYDKYKRSPVAQSVALQGLGFSPKSGGALRLSASLVAYGLVEASGSGDARNIKLSDDAYKIIVDTRSYSPERDNLIKKAALKPPIFMMIKDKYPDDFPAEDALSHDLKINHDFNPNSVHHFINIIFKTFEFAKVYETDIIPDENEAYQRHDQINKGDNIVAQLLNSTIKSSEKERFNVPLSVEYGREEIAKFIVGQGKTISLIADGKITQKSIKKLIKMLEMNVEDFPEDDNTSEISEAKDS